MIERSIDEMTLHAAYIYTPHEREPHHHERNDDTPIGVIVVVSLCTFGEG